MLPFIEIFGRTVGTYSLVSMFGLLLSGFVAFRMGKRYNVQFENIVLMMLCAAGGLLIGAHILYGITNIDKLYAVLKNIGTAPFMQIVNNIAVIFGGMVFYGGFFGALIAVLIFTKFSKTVKRSPALDMLAVTVPLFHTFGRIGCFLGGCCYGIESRFGFFIESNPLQPDVAGVVRLPIQLIEAALNLLIFVLLFTMFKKNKLSGKLIFLYMPIYAIIRFCLEFFRGDAVRGFFLGISTSQWISLMILVFTLIRILVLRIRKTKKSAS